MTRTEAFKVSFTALPLEQSSILRFATWLLQADNGGSVSIFGVVTHDYTNDYTNDYELMAPLKSKDGAYIVLPGFP